VRLDRSARLGFRFGYDTEGRKPSAALGRDQLATQEIAIQRG
jgi:hypothetical protein